METSILEKAFSKRPCVNCEFGSYFKDSFECVECKNNPVEECKGLEEKFKLASDLKSRLLEFKHLAEIGEAVEWAIRNDIQWITTTDQNAVSLYDCELDYLMGEYRSQLPAE